MINYYRVVMLCLVSCLMGRFVYAGALHNHFYRTFWNPAFHQARLSYCNRDGNTCGLPLATAYCKLMGYTKAYEMLIDNNIGLANYFDSQSQCQGWKCNGFKFIRCKGFISHKRPRVTYYRSQRFSFPRFNHYRVAWCYNDDKKCGKRAAYSFCRRLGFSRDESFSIDSHVPATKALGDQKLCFGDACNGFKQITCYR